MQLFVGTHFAILLSFVEIADINTHELIGIYI